MTSTAAAHDSSPPTAGARRLRFGLQSLVLLISVTASCLFVGLIASRYPIRLDATASREHLLSERTRTTLDGLQGQYEIIVAANRASVDSRAFERTRDVLDSFGRASKQVGVTFIDTGSSSGIAEYDALLKRLSERYKPQIDSNRAALDRAMTTCRDQRAVVETLIASLIGIKDSVRGTDLKSEQLRRLMDDYAARARVAAFNLDQAVSGAGKALLQPIGPEALGLLPIDDVALQLSKAVGTVTSDLARLLREMKLVDQAADVPGVVKDQVRPIVPAAQGSLDTLRSTADTLERLPRVALFAVARTLEKSSAALVVGPPRSQSAVPSDRRGPGAITAIDFASLFPPALPDGAATGVTLDRRARAEELTATALASLSAVAPPPIVVLVHDQPTRFAPTFEPFVAMIDRLNLRGIDVVEWATALDLDEPSLASIQQTGTGMARPVVYVTQTTSPNTQDAADRMKRMASAMSKLIAQGKSVLVSANVSTLPGIGTPDPLVECLAPVGIKVDSGRPLMQRAQTPTGPLVVTDFFPQRAANGTDDAGTHPIARAIDGLSMHFFWVVPIHPGAPTVAPPGGTTARLTPLVRIDHDANTWAESEWLGYARIPAGQRSSVIDPPAPDSPRDEAQGPWAMVLASERSDPMLDAGVQRVVVVGCSGWFLDDVTQQSVGVIDGRPVLSSPGNLELLEASVLWLARQDELIARSPTAQAVPTIRTLSRSQTQAVRWSLIAGLPAVVLLIGICWRLVKG